MNSKAVLADTRASSAHTHDVAVRDRSQVAHTHTHSQAENTKHLHATFVQQFIRKVNQIVCLHNVRARIVLTQIRVTTFLLNELYFKFICVGIKSNENYAKWDPE